MTKACTASLRRQSLKQFGLSFLFVWLNNNRYTFDVIVLLFFMGGVRAKARTTLCYCCRTAYTENRMRQLCENYAGLCSGNNNLMYICSGFAF
jgi:hypothetical protein